MKTLGLAKSLGLAVATLAALGLAAHPAQAQNLVQNGGFETGTLGPWTTNSVLNTVTASPNFVHSGTYGFSYGSVGLPDSTLSQSLTTVPGASYTITFFQHQLAGTPNELSVSFGGTSLFDQTNLPEQGWHQYSFTGTATGTSTALSFGLRQDPSYSGLDDISVTANSAVMPTPEPSSVAAFAFTGLGALGLALKARKRQPGTAA